MENNGHAGQGAVLLDIGGDIGALVVTMPPAMLGTEIEIRPTGKHVHGHLVHAAVVNRPTNAKPVPSLVLPELHEGDYEIYERPSGQIRLPVHVAGGEVTHLTWPLGGAYDVG